MKVRWSARASLHLDAIHDYIAQDSPEYATKTVQRILKRARQIAHFPQSGRVVPELDSPEIREVIEGPYRIVYVVKSEIVYVVAVFHAAQQPPWGPE